MKVTSHYFLLLLILILPVSCKIDTCSSGRPILNFDGFSKAELRIIEVKEFEPGSGWSKVKRTFYIGDSIKTQGLDSVAWGDFYMVDKSFYEFKILSSGTTYSVFNMQHKVHKMKRYIAASRKGCTNGFSYWVNANQYTVAPNEYPGYGNSQYVRLIIYK